MTIRPETPRDYAAIAGVHVRAFGNRASEATVVALRRQFASFDPGLSLVAEVDGRIVGHALFTPERIRLLGREAPAVNLAPIAVEPACQRRGIGAALIAGGHAAARARGFSLSFLLGHPAYYARFGYLPRMFGAASSVVKVAAPCDGGLESRAPREDDIPALHALWLYEEGNVDFAIDPGEELLGWMSPNPMIPAVVYTRGDAILGYARVHAREPLAPRIFLARDAAAAHAMASDLVRRAGLAFPSELVLPLHPSSASARVLGNSVCEVWEAGMACALSSGLLEDYCARVRESRRLPGAPVWPVAFDLA